MKDPQAKRPSRTRSALIDRNAARLAELKAELREAKERRAVLNQPLVQAAKKQKNYDLTQLGVVAADMANRDPKFRARLIAHALALTGRATQNLRREGSLLYNLGPEAEGAEKAEKAPRGRPKGVEPPAPSEPKRKPSEPTPAPPVAQTHPTRRRPPPAPGANTNRWYAYPENAWQAEGAAAWIAEASLWRTTLDRQHKKMIERNMEPVDDLTGISLRGLRAMKDSGQWPDGIEHLRAGISSLPDLLGP